MNDSGWIAMCCWKMLELSKNRQNIDPRTCCLLPKYFKRIQESPWIILKHSNFVNQGFGEIQNCGNVGKDGRRENPTIRLIKS